MILQRLNEYYERKQASPDATDHLPAFGLEEKAIPFIIELAADGTLVNIADTQEYQGKKKVAQRFLVPKGVKKTSGVAANLLWDTAEYVLGISTEELPREEKLKRKQLKRLADQRAAFKEQIENLPSAYQQDSGIKAVLSFLETVDLDRLARFSSWEEIKTTNPVMSFRLHGDDPQLIPQRLGLKATDEGVDEAGPTMQGTCLITGDAGPIQRTHDAIKGVWGAQPSGGNIVSFDKDSFQSYGKRQGYNATIGRPAAFAYTTALNHLLAKGSKQRVQVGDASTVFWAAQPHELELLVPDLFGEPTKDNPDLGADALKRLLRSVETGKFSLGQEDTLFHVLGLAPNRARISIRFWETAEAEKIARRIKQHFDDVDIVRTKDDPQHISIGRMLRAVSRKKSDGTYDIAPNLGGDVMHAIMQGLPYPSTLLNHAVQRCHAEQTVTQGRAAVLKAFLNRSIRQSNPNSSNPEPEYTTMRDTSNLNPAYRLGRLFAALEKIQQEANDFKERNATIRDRYYGAASSTPATVFGSLLDQSTHHLSKLRKDKPGLHRVRQDLITEIISGLDVNNLPTHLRLKDQAKFGIGYYHERMHLYPTKNTTPEPSNN